MKERRTESVGIDFTTKVVVTGVAVRRLHLPCQKGGGAAKAGGGAQAGCSWLGLSHANNATSNKLSVLTLIHM